MCFLARAVGRSQDCRRIIVTHLEEQIGEIAGGFLMPAEGRPSSALTPLRYEGKLFIRVKICCVFSCVGIASRGFFGCYRRYRVGREHWMLLRKVLTVGHIAR